MILRDKRRVPLNSALCRLVLRYEAQHVLIIKHLMLGFMLQPNLQKTFQRFEQGTDFASIQWHIDPAGYDLPAGPGRVHHVGQPGRADAGSGGDRRDP